MSLSPMPPLPSSSSPLAALMAALQPESRGDMLTPPQGHPLVDPGQCRVSGCPGLATAARRLCDAHADRWYRARRLGAEFDQWLTDCPPRCAPKPCLVRGCRFGRHRSKLCLGHHEAWSRTKRAGDAADWSITVRAESVDHRGCSIPGCDLWASFNAGFCVSHHARFNAYRRRSGIDDRDAFLAATALAGVPCIDLIGLAPQLKLEVQYIVQCYLNSGPRPINLTSWNAVIRALHAVGAVSLLDRTAPAWVADLKLNGHRNPDGALFLTWGHDQVDRLIRGTGWDREFPMDTWSLARVGHAATGVARINFKPIPQRWLRDLVKIWTRHRLSIGIGPAGVRRGVGILAQFATYLDNLTRPPRGAGDVTRGMVQHWCEDLARHHHAPRARMQLASGLSTFLRDVHRYGWAPDLPSTTVVFSEDFPRMHGTGPGRALTEYVIAQIETDEALARLDHPDHQLMTRIMIRCGLRAGDCRQLTLDCLIHDGEGHPYLQYLNHKMKRTAYVPVDDDLAARVRSQQQAVLQRFDPQRPSLLLFPGSASNPHGTKAYPASGYRSAFQRWLAELKVTDELGRPVWITPHQLRHTFGTRLINRDVPQHIVQQLMDHSSPDMTAHYARLSDKTIRDAWAKAQLIDIHGNPVDLDDDHPLADAAWARRGIDRAKQTLPNGYCGMPLNSPCEHANPCLTCPMFITNADFLPQHETQLKHTIELIDISRDQGHLRVVEKNQEIVDNLRRIITSCQTCPATNQQKVADAR